LRVVWSIEENQGWRLQNAGYRTPRQVSER